MSPSGGSSPKIIVEVCTASLDGAKIAERAGADRIELNVALELDGLTPSPGLLRLVSEAVQIPIIAMARPRPGNFCYSSSQWETLITDARWLLENGADGIAFGCLDGNLAVDLERCKQIRDLAGTKEIVFHKAFDDVSDWKEGLERLVDSGIDRVMTSGQCPTAEAGLMTIAEMNNLAAGRIEIIPAGRINSENAVKIVEQTGCQQVHGSFSPNNQANISNEIQQTIALLASRSIAY